MRQRLLCITRRSLIPKDATFIRRINTTGLRSQVTQEQPSTPFQRYVAQFNQNHQVDTRWVRIKSSTGVSDPRSLSSLLREVDGSNQTFVQISKPGTQREAVVEVLTIEQLRDRFQASVALVKAQRSSQKESKAKQVELNWAIGDHDLAMKLNQLEQFLDKGKKVEIVLAPKREGRRATTQEANGLLQKIREKLVECDSKEIAPLEGTVLRTAIMKVRKKGHG